MNEIFRFSNRFVEKIHETLSTYSKISNIMNETKNQAISVQRKINISNVEKNIKTSLIRSKISNIMKKLIN